MGKAETALKQAISSISFLAILIAWSFGLLSFCAYELLTNGKVDDFGVIIFWSGLFELLAWLIFIWPVLTRLNHQNKFFRFPIFPIITTIYSELVFITLIGWLFFSTDYYVVFVVAGTVGLTFGIIYLPLIKNNKLVELINTKDWTRLLILAYPVAFLTLFLWVFPLTFPATAFRVMPDQIQHQIIARTIPKFKVGDEIQPLLNALPGYFEHIEDGSMNSFASMENFAFVIQVHCYKIIRLEYGRTQQDFDDTIYGKLQEEPCP